ncbi:DUF5654 family protein [Methanobrevibacter curvatus]|uniref:Uncharacterized protein n=1 Tax=Methanobrevibacter curvatus TaxID=49547 RepID=A0A166B0M2_9EURY|nr:DUF5654 family protein [Methanobrevibacter curvatus]KZX12713.1 hypothetical protein MBCUR_09660 [Methanobrevibacter curvatus]
MTDSVKVEILKTTATLITTAFALVAGLAWNEAIKAIISTFFKEGSAIPGYLTYAIIVTVIAVLVAVLFARSLGKLGIELDD